MSDKKLTIDDIEVPEEMLVAAYEYAPMSFVRTTMNRMLAAALLYLAEHPIVPSLDDSQSMNRAWNGDKLVENDFTQAISVEWQRRMFLKREPELPEEVRSLLWKSNSFRNNGAQYRHDTAVKQAYELGRKAAMQKVK